MKELRFVFLAALLVIPSQATAGSLLGLRGGIGFDPDQLVAGVQFGTAARTGVVRILPSVDVGLSDDVTTFSFNADVLLDLNLQGSSIGFFGGAGPTIAYYDFDGPGSDWKTGISLIGGIKSAVGGADLEFRFGMGDIPDFRIMLTIHL